MFSEIWDLPNKHKPSIFHQDEDAIAHDRCEHGEERGAAEFGVVFSKVCAYLEPPDRAGGDVVQFGEGGVEPVVQLEFQAVEVHHWFWAICVVGLFIGVRCLFVGPVRRRAAGATTRRVPRAGKRWRGLAGLRGTGGTYLFCWVFFGLK